MISRDALVTWLNTYLNISHYPDASQNGLQIEGKTEISRIAVAVDTSLRTLTDAIDAGADMLIVHHGLFWGQSPLVVGPLAKRLKVALEAGLNLYVAHIPLDAHPEVGNNAMLAQALSLQDVQPFGQYRGRDIGFKGVLPFPLELQDLADRLQRTTGEVCLVHGGGKGTVSSIGIISGAAAKDIGTAAQAGLDVFITGEPSHAQFADAFEYGINTIYIGHYESEIFGVRALAARIEEEFGLGWQFIHVPTGL